MSLESTGLRTIKRYGISATLKQKTKSYNADTGETEVFYNEGQSVYLFEDTSKANKLRLEGLIENTDTLLIVHSKVPIEVEMIIETQRYDYTILRVEEHKNKEKDILYSLIAKRTKK